MGLAWGPRGQDMGRTSAAGMKLPRQNWGRERGIDAGREPPGEPMLCMVLPGLAEAP